MGNCGADKLELLDSDQKAREMDRPTDGWPSNGGKPQARQTMGRSGSGPVVVVVLQYLGRLQMNSFGFSNLDDSPGLAWNVYQPTKLILFIIRWHDRTTLNRTLANATLPLVMFNCPSLTQQTRWVIELPRGSKLFTITHQGNSLQDS